MQNKKICFIVCPIGEENSDTRKNSDKLFEHLIEPICKELDFECIRVDKLNNPNSITSDILDYLKTADLVIADLSEHNPNAFYEIGYRKALNLPIIHIKNKSTRIPFDISDIRTFDYSFDISDSAEFQNRIKQTINTFDFNSNKNLKLKPSNNTFDSQLLSSIYNIQDDIKYIKECVSHNNKETVSVLADKLASKNKVSDEALMIQTFISEIFRNPETFKALVAMSENKN